MSNARPEIWRTILEQLPTVVYLLDGEQKILFWNAGAERITGRLSQDVVGRLLAANLIARADVGDNPESPNEIRPSIPTRAKAAAVRATSYLNHTDGHRIPISLRTFPVRDPEGHVIGAAESFEERIAAPRMGPPQEQAQSYGCVDNDDRRPHPRFRRVPSARKPGHLLFPPGPFRAFSAFKPIDMDNVRHKYGRARLKISCASLVRRSSTACALNDIVGHWDEDEFLVLLVGM